MTTRSILATALLVAVATAPAALAQGSAGDSVHRRMPMDGMARMEGPGQRQVQIRVMGDEGMGGPTGGIASMILGQTAALKLTDAQVTRLAGLARNAEAQRETMRASMDSLHKAMMAHMASGAGMPSMPPDMEARMKTMHDQMHANVRDALAVLTPDQLATAWEAMHGMGGMGGMHMMMMRGMGDGMGMGMRDGMQHEERVIIQKP